MSTSATFTSFPRKSLYATKTKRRFSRCLATTQRGLNFLEWAGKVIPQGPVVSSVKQAWKFTWLTLMRELAPQSEAGSFVRSSYAFHNDIGSDPIFPVENGRYHVYLGNACPWCHRVLLALVVLGLEDAISYGAVQDDPERASRGGWIFENTDPITDCSDLRGVYDKCCGDRDGFRGRCTAPLFIDKKEMRIVSNESGKIVRNLISISFDGERGVDLRPNALEERIDKLNASIYDHVNNGVYKCGFATSQQGYDSASEALFAELERLNNRLANSRFLLGDKFTESDLWLYPTMIRFEPVYSIVLRCSKRRLYDFPHLYRWLKDVYRIQLLTSHLQIRDTMDWDDARRSYCSLFPLNPGGIVYDGPDAVSMGLEGSLDPSIDAESFFYTKMDV